MTCRIEGCECDDLMAFGLCAKHYLADYNANTQPTHPPCNLSKADSMPDLAAAA